MSLGPGKAHSVEHGMADFFHHCMGRVFAILIPRGDELRSFRQWETWDQYNQDTIAFFLSFSR